MKFPGFWKKNRNGTVSYHTCSERPKVYDMESLVRALAYVEGHPAVYSTKQAYDKDRKHFLAGLAEMDGGT